MLNEEAGAPKVTAEEFGENGKPNHRDLSEARAMILPHEFSKVTALRNRYVHGPWFTHQDGNTYLRLLSVDHRHFSNTRRVTTKGYKLDFIVILLCASRRRLAISPTLKGNGLNLIWSSLFYKVWGSGDNMAKNTSETARRTGPGISSFATRPDTIHKTPPQTAIFQNQCYPEITVFRKRNIEMTPLCKVEVTHPGFWGPGRYAVAMVSMSKQEFSRLDVLLRVQSGRLRVSETPVR